MAFFATIKTPDSGIREVQISEGETFLGRDPANSMVLGGRGVSRRHARMTLKGGRLTISDLGSTYGTRVNNVVTRECQLRDGDIVTVGMNYLIIKAVLDLVEPIEESGWGNKAPDPLEDGFFSEDVTQPIPDDIHRRKTIQMNRNAVQFIIDNPDPDGRAVKVLPKSDSSIMRAVERMGAVGTERRPLSEEVDRSDDYKALLLMYKVSELLATAAEFDGFMNSVADLVIDEVGADTAVILLREGEGDFHPKVIRHSSPLHEGEIPVSRGVVQRVIHEKVALIINDPLQETRVKTGQSIQLYNIRAIMAFPLLAANRLHGVLYLSRTISRPFNTADSDLVAALAALMASAIDAAMLKDRIEEEKRQRSALERFHPPEVVDRIFQGGLGESSFDEHMATVLVCHLHGFRELTERAEPRQLAGILHEYYEMLYDKIFANGGTLVKLHEGWALALFGTPQSPDRDAVWAVEAAHTAVSDFLSVVTLWPSSSTLQLSCALDTGMVISGLVGSQARMEYAAIGRPITGASTIARTFKQSGVVLSERTWSELPQKYFTVKMERSSNREFYYRLEKKLT